MTDQSWYIGKLKFFENTKGFGFVMESRTGRDYFVHVSNVDADVISLSDNIIFKLVSSKKKPGTLEAKNVHLLRQFKSDPNFLIAQFLLFSDFSIRKDILAALSSDGIRNIADLTLQSVEKVSNDEEYKAFREKVNSIYQGLDDSTKRQIVNDIANNHLEETITDEYKIKLWLRDEISSEPELAKIRKYILVTKEFTYQKIYPKLCEDSRLKLVDMYIEENDINSSLTYLLSFLEWENDVEVGIKITDNFTKKLANYSLKFDHQDEKHQALIASQKWLEKSIFSKIVDFYYLFSIDIVKLKLWLHDVVSKGDYNIYHANFIFLNNVEQQRYIKKLFFLLMNNAGGISYENISSLRHLTFTYSEAKPFHLDFSCNVLIQSIESLRNGKFLTEEEIFLILGEHIQTDPSDLLSLGGFFEKCNGRSVPNKVNELESGNREIASLKKKHIPPRVIFCEGVRFGENGKDRVYNHDCWWCRGGCCFDANQNSHLSHAYEKFTLSDFLTILNISFNKKSYFDFLGLLNKIEVFLRHLRCRSCHYMLKPNRDSYYSYYRISNFVCAK